MKNTILFNTRGEYWFFNPIGTGVIFTYIPRAKQVVTTCANSGQIIEVNNYSKEDCFRSKEEFYQAAIEIYLGMVDEGVSIDIDYFDNISIVGCVGVDFDLIKN